MGPGSGTEAPVVSMEVIITVIILTAAAAAAIFIIISLGKRKRKKEEEKKPVKPQVSRDAVEQLREEYGVREDEED
ncbi:Region of a membrane-bound protein predicted to be embedded in the membrane [Methanothermobacter wolfeii]|uniref:Uncharacterized protein n=1 Tax=Methanothermobacter wolfeii TaxID=145261 RepID=A0A9E7UKX7_METWO|nr:MULTISPECIES: hypothetical protein [Methanothermobacter]NLM02934.1 hypothetical protein [Methanothermobacter wolfeii]QHN06365.1 hypothetical protein FZP57_04310 [Methanothermobacter sp. THM-1]UXH30845.1 hypothetical protein N5910_04620 [Methanothermobacter wolfeii]SCM57125.1 Region of a membrane-bound protein predicted to be embedded in the membrane [Methanothermobacter wolfeii]